WLEAIGELTLPIDLDRVRQLLPTTPFGQGALLREPAPLTWGRSEGALVRNPEHPAEWGIFYNANARPERQRFTIAHELGHFVLHRDLQRRFDCDQESVYSGIDTLKQIEREADDFASTLLMPAHRLRERIERQRIDVQLLSELAREFGVSLEAMCIRVAKLTEQRLVLVYWDYGFMKYQWRSRSAIRTRVRLHRTDDPQEPFAETLAADEAVVQEWAGVQMPAARWCASEPPGISLREMKHSYPEGHRVLSLLVLESAAPRDGEMRGWDEEDHSEGDRLTWGR
ncbi:ImmA/IrrE family metallo-endopeptidase, partial [Lamprobacter modestohalophilus]|uniref:ImmA/IrrE family metallo-endopeptidase n=1 Tax=Lamprobacter modestohalophilus TaxID=1064514 RepID=UPI002ADEE82E